MKKKHYLLFMYGNLGTTSEFTSFINSVFDPVKEGNLKFVHDRSSAICHFASKENIQALTEFFNDIFDDNISAFVLMERSNFGFGMDDKVSHHLFDLNQMTGYEDFSKLLLNDFDEEFLKWTEKKIMDLGLNNNSNPERLFDEEEGMDIKTIRESYKEPLRMNDILDKISANGISSLSNEEKKFLKSFSEN